MEGITGDDKIYIHDKGYKRWHRGISHFGGDYNNI